MTPKQKPGKSKQNYRTPDDFRAAVLARLGIERFAHDLAADSENAFASTYYDEATDALRMHRERGWWTITRDWMWLNPPFSDITPWAQACAETAARGGQVAFLVPASVGANWFRDHVHGKAKVLFLNGRIHFMADHPKWGYPKDCMLALYSPHVTPGYHVWSWK